MAFFLSKFAWAFLSPGPFLVLLLSAGLVLQRRTRFVGRFLSILAASILFALTVLPLGEWALTPLENRFLFAPPEHVDGIIVIGGDEKPMVAEARGMPVVPLDSMRRYATFADLARRYPEARMMFSGGPPVLRPQARLQDADVARANLAIMGVPVERMVFEAKSRTTYENAVFAKQLGKPEKNQRWLLVTSAWHMPRALATFRHAGWPVDPAPTGYFTLGDYAFHVGSHFDDQMHMLTMAMHEYIGLAAYWLMGRTGSLWP